MISPMLSMRTSPRGLPSASSSLAMAQTSCINHRCPVEEASFAIEESLKNLHFC